MPRCSTACIHFEVCKNNANYTGIKPDIDIKPSNCSLYENKNLFKKLPCEEGAIVYEIIPRTDDFDGQPYLVISQATFSVKDIDRIGKTLFLSKADAIIAKEEMLKKVERRN